MVYAKQTWANSPSTTTPISAARLGVIESGIVSIDRGTFASRPASGQNVGDLYECTDIGNQYRWNGSAWEVSRGGDLEIFTPPPSTGWTALNSASVTAALDSRVVSSTTSGADNWKAEERTLSPTSNYTATFYIDHVLAGVNYVIDGIILRNSGSNLFVSFGLQYNAGWVLVSANWNSTTSFNAVATQLPAMEPPNWMRVSDNATNRTWQYSFNGVDWITHSTISRTSFISAPDRIGWGVNASVTSITQTARLRSFAVT